LKEEEQSKKKEKEALIDDLVGNFVLFFFGACSFILYLPHARRSQEGQF
jgi:hypothetical protein